MKKMSRSLVRYLFLCALGVVVLLQLTPKAYSAEGRIPIYTCTTIDRPGSYILTQKILADGSFCPCLNIIASRVTIDFAGQNIEVQDPACTGIQVTGTVTDIIIKNGVISGGNDGIRIQDGVGGEYRIENMTIVNVNGIGILVEGTTAGFGNPCTTGENPARATLVGNVVKAGITSNAYAGLYLHCVEGARVEKNQLRENFVGILIEDVRNSFFDHNVVTDNVDTGIEMNYSIMNTVSNNIVTKNFDKGGIYIGPGSDMNIIEGNNTSTNTDTWSGTGGGIVVDGASFNSIRRNTSTNAGTGIALINGATGNTLEWNHLGNNTNASLFFDATACGNVYGYNRYLGGIVSDGCTGNPPNISLDFSGDTNGP